jgi:hypothetical protein
MRPEELSDERLDEALRRQPRWEPSRHFARAVIARMPVAIPASSPGPRSLVMVFQAAAVGALCAAVALAAGLLVSWTTLQAIPGAVAVAAAYEMLLESATVALIEHATPVAWITAAVALAIAASVSGHAQEWT